MANNSTWRETRISIPANIPTRFSEGNTQPNFFIIVNNSASTIYVGVSPLVGASTFEIIVPALGTRTYARPDAPNELWLYATADSSVYIGSMEKEFSENMVAQTQEIATVAASGLLGVVDIRSILNALPAGANKIGSVDVVTLPVIPAGTNAIGTVGINAAIPTGNNTIGNVKDAGQAFTVVSHTGDYTTQQTAAALWTPGTGKKFVITDIHISSATAGTITLLDDTGTIRKYIVAANETIVEPLTGHEVSAAADNILKITTSAAMTVFINVKGYEI